MISLASIFLLAAFECTDIGLFMKPPAWLPRDIPSDAIPQLNSSTNSSTFQPFNFSTRLTITNGAANVFSLQDGFLERCYLPLLSAPRIAYGDDSYAEFYCPGYGNISTNIVHTNESGMAFYSIDDTSHGVPVWSISDTNLYQAMKANYSSDTRPQPIQDGRFWIDTWDLNDEESSVGWYSDIHEFVSSMTSVSPNEYGIYIPEYIGTDSRRFIDLDKLWPIRDWLFHSHVDDYWSYHTIRDGLAAGFGSTALDAIVANPEPTGMTYGNWYTDYPFYRLGGSETFFPTFGSLLDDGLFWHSPTNRPPNYDNQRSHARELFFNFRNIWGDPGLTYTTTDFHAAIERPVTNTVIDVLDSLSSSTNLNSSTSNSIYSVWTNSSRRILADRIALMSTVEGLMDVTYDSNTGLYYNNYTNLMYVKGEQALARNISAGAVITWSNNTFTAGGLTIQGPTPNFSHTVTNMQSVVSVNNHPVAIADASHVDGGFIANSPQLPILLYPNRQSELILGDGCMTNYIYYQFLHIEEPTAYKSVKLTASNQANPFLHNETEIFFTDDLPVNVMLFGNIDINQVERITYPPALPEFTRDSFIRPWFFSHGLGSIDLFSFNNIMTFATNILGEASWGYQPYINGGCINRRFMLNKRSANSSDETLSAYFHTFNDLLINVKSDFSRYTGHDLDRFTDPDRRIIADADITEITRLLTRQGGNWPVSIVPYYPDGNARRQGEYSWPNMINYITVDGEITRMWYSSFVTGQGLIEINLMHLPIGAWQIGSYQYVVAAAAGKEVHPAIRVEGNQSLMQKNYWNFRNYHKEPQQ